MNPSNLQILRVLMAKDWRLFRVPLVGLLIIALAARLIAALGPLISHGKETVTDWRRFAAVAALYLTGVVAAAFGGISIAGERRDGTADFIGLLPLSRRQIILSKWAVSFLLLMPVAALHGGVAWLTQMNQWKGEQMYELRHDLADWAAQAAFWIGCTSSFFGLAWLIGSFSRSAVISASASIAVSLGVFIVTSSLAEPATHVLQDEWRVPLITAIPLFLLGLACLIGGTVHYLKRIEP